MPSYRPPVSRDQYHVLEAYYFKLVLFTMTADYGNLSTPQMRKVDKELLYIELSLDILKQLLSAKNANERAVYGWPVSPEDFGYDVLFLFSCLKTASLATSCNQSKISAVCKEKISNTGGWVFCYKEDFETRYRAYESIELLIKPTTTKDE